MNEKKDTRTLPPQIQQELRRRVIRQRQLSKTNRQVAKALGVSERHASTVWQRYLREGGTSILNKKRGRKTGQHRKMGIKQDKQTLDLMFEKPSSMGLVGELWSRLTLQQAIERHLKINVSIRTVGERLKLWGMVPVKSIKINSEDNPPKIQKWISNDYQKLLERAQQEGSEIHWCVEKSIKGCKSGSEFLDYYCLGIPMLASISNKGQIRFMLGTGDITSDSFVEFMISLTADVDKKVFLLVKRIMCLYMDTVVESWLDNNKDRIEVLYLPL
ncbi:MAG: winged helix-turn-helix domain-containing protein [Geobacteraceae bacterium]|nr:winged helix-turn-helix domain-containing protein [Geobacteraceae bacterium]